MAKQNTTSETAAPKTAESASAVDAAKPGAAKAPAIASKVMYIGPSFAKDGVLFQHGQLFNNGIPVPWLDWVGSAPEFRLLLVPHEKIVQRLAELKDPDSAVSLAYKKAEDAAKTFKKGK
ncbi:MAG: hypothetical protein LBS30_01865 [Planctomycetota bacterium]|nr:hypothetical protein [Planctomycetota bacterium]